MVGKKNMNISVVIPVFNESANVQLLADRLEGLETKLYEVIWVNDGSRDDTLEVIKNISAQDGLHKYIDLSRNFGQQIAFAAGLDYCTGDHVVFMDGDGQDPPELIEELTDKINEGYDIVYARRVSREGESMAKKVTARWFYRILNSWVPFELPADVGDFRIINKKVINALREMREQHKFLRGQLAWMGFNQGEVTYHRPDRARGKTQYTLSKMWKLAWDAITVFSDVPLKLITWLGVIVTLFAFGVMSYALYSRFILQDFVQGWTSIIIAVMFVGGIQMIAIGIIGSYMHRTHQNTLRRPLYFVKETFLDKK